MDLGGIIKWRDTQNSRLYEVFEVWKFYFTSNEDWGFWVKLYNIVISPAKLFLFLRRKIAKHWRRKNRREAQLFAVMNFMIPAPKSHDTKHRSHDLAEVWRENWLATRLWDSMHGVRKHNIINLQFNSLSIQKLDVEVLQNVSKMLAFDLLENFYDECNKYSLKRLVCECDIL